MKNLLILALMLISSQANAGEFWTDDKLANGLMLASNALLVADWGQTRNSTDKGYAEVGLAEKFIGDRPTTGDVNRYFAASILRYNLINYLLPTKYKKWHSGATATYELLVVKGNYRVGVGIRF